MTPVELPTTAIHDIGASEWLTKEPETKCTSPLRKGISRKRQKAFLCMLIYVN